MNDDLEKALRATLRPIDPGEDFTRRVTSRLASEPLPRRAPMWERPAWLAMAASLVLALAGASLWQVHRVREGQQARQQLLEALRVTDQTLHVAYRAVNEPSALRTPSGQSGS